MKMTSAPLKSIASLSLIIVLVVLVLISGGL